MKTKIYAVACGLFMLGGCASDVPVGLVEPSFGAAVRQNAASEIVNPMAPQDRGPLTANGQRAALQQERYLTDKVEAPQDTSTLMSSTGGGNGGNGGGGTGAGGAPAGAGATAR